MNNLDKTETKVPKLKKKRKYKKFIIIIIILIIISGVGYYVSYNMKKKAAEPMKVETALVSKKDIDDTVMVDGVVTGSESAEVTSPVNYKILKINVKEGDRVNINQTLAVLDAKDINDEIRKTENDIELAEITLQEDIKNKQAQYDSALLKLKDAERVLSQTQALYNTGAASEDELIAAQRAVEDIKNTIENMDIKDGKAVETTSQRRNIDIQKDNLKMIESTLDKALIKSPISGTVTRVNAKLGRYATDTEDKAAMFIIDDLDNLLMKVKVDEKSIGKIKIGQKAVITADVLGEDKMEGELIKIAPTGEDDTDSRGNVRKVIPVTIAVTKTSPKMIPGLKAKAEIEISSSKGVLTVPTESIKEGFDGEDKSVFILGTDNTVKKINVKTGVEDTFDTQIITDKIKEGDKVIINPGEDISDGMKAEDKAENTENKDGKADAENK